MNITLEELLRITWDVVRVVIFDLKKEILFDGLVMEIENHDGLLNKEVVEIETGVRASQNECYNILSVERGYKNQIEYFVKFLGWQYEE